MVATFNGNPCTTIISCCRPTIVSEETDLITFYNGLSSHVRSIPKHNVLVIGGDMNAETGKNVNNKFSLQNSSNKNGEHRTDFTLVNSLTCLNTKFQKRKRKLWTYTFAKNTKAQTDYILINKIWNISALNSEAYSSFECLPSDRRTVTAMIRLSLQKNAVQTTTTVLQNWSLLNNRDIWDRYTLTRRKKFDPLQEISETPASNDKYKNFINAHLEAASECLPTKQRAKPKVTWETLVVRKKRADVKTASKCNSRKPTNINAQKLMKAQNELPNICIPKRTNRIHTKLDE